MTQHELFEHYSSPIEFDAYSKGITENIKYHIQHNPNSRQTTIEWLKSCLCYLTPELMAYENAFKNWQQSDQINKTDYIRRLKIRFYNELYNERL